MFFLIRCVFWLWVVFSTIFAEASSHGPAVRQPQRPQANVAATPSVAESWLRGAAAEVADRCAAAPTTCLAVAAQLSRFGASGNVASAPRPAVMPHADPSGAPLPRRVAVPLPPRRPNFAAL